jgi:hypothetical protein
MGQCLVARTKVAVPCVTLADALRQPHLAHDSNRQQEAQCHIMAESMAHGSGLTR